jgi:AsmA protein
VKRWAKILLVIVGAVVAAIASIPLFVNANTFRPAIEKQLTTALGREVKLGDLSLSIFRGSLVAKDLSISEDPDFSATPFLTAKEFRIGVSLRMLLFSHQLDLRSFQIEEPQINLIRGTNGRWNFSSIGHSATASSTGTAGSAPDTLAAGSKSAKTQSTLPNLSVELIAIENARASMASLFAHGEPSVFEAVNVTARNFSFTSQFPFELSANLPADGSISATGHLGPLDRTDAAASPADAEIIVKRLDPVAGGFLNPSAGLSFVADAEMHAASDGQVLTTQGTAHIENLKLRKGGSAASKPIDVAYSDAHHLKGNSGEIQDASIKIGNSAIHLTGTYQPVASGGSEAPQVDDPLLNFRLVGQSLPIDELQPLMTAAAIRLPNGSVLKGGTLSMKLAITGQAKSLVIVGPLALDNTTLVGFDIASKIHGIAAMSGMKPGDTTKFEKVRVDVHVSENGVVADNIDAVIPAMGELTGSGTVSPADQLDFNFTIKNASAKGIGKVGVGFLTMLNGSGGSSGNGPGVPMHVAGTSEEPYITASVGGAVGKKTKSIVSVFGKKK